MVPSICQVNIVVQKSFTMVIPGCHHGVTMDRIYGEHIARKTGDPDITFKEVLDKCGIELCIVVTNLRYRGVATMVALW